MFYKVYIYGYIATKIAKKSLFLSKSMVLIEYRESGEDGIPQYVRARLTVFTLLFSQLKPTNKYFCPNFSQN